MGYLKRAETVMLPLPSDPAFWVRIKPKLSFGDMQYRLNKVMKLRFEGEGEAAEQKTDYEIGTMNMATLERAIDSWNLTDEDEQPLEVCPESIALLLPEDADFLVREINERNPQPRNKRAKNGSSGSSIAG